MKTLLTIWILVVATGVVAIIYVNATINEQIGYAKCEAQ